jgi:hypothetical protein
MYYTIYKTTNTVTGEFYVGQHATEDLDDGYLGSGVSLLESIKKYDKENFIKNILYVFDNETDMNAKEIELVDEDFLSDPLVLNRQSGGTGLKSSRKSIVAFDNGKWKRIRVEDYNPSIHITPTTGTIRVFDCEKNVIRRIPTQEYHKNKNRYKTASSGKVSVIHRETNQTSSIDLNDYDPVKHKKVIGGIVAEVDGKLKYVSKEQFLNDNLKGCHYNKVTVLDKQDGKQKHIIREEYYNNLDRYSPLTKGMVTVYDTLQDKYTKISVNDFYGDLERYSATTTGQRTVWDIETKMFKNIPKESFDRKCHRLSSDKRILCYKSSGEIIIDFWGSKKDFVKLYGIEVYNQALKQTENYQPKQHKKFSTYVGCSFKLIDWRNQNE